MNCAEQLSKLLLVWQPASGETPLDARGRNDDDHLATWRRQAHAASLVLEVERALDGLDATGHGTAPFRQHLPSWYEGVFSAPQQLTTAIGGPVPRIVDPVSLQMLQALSSLLDVQYREPELPPSDRDGLLAMFQEADQLVRSTEEIRQPQLRIGLLGLIEGARQALTDIDDVGLAVLRARVAELSLYLGTAAAQDVTDDAVRDSFTSLAKRLWARVGLLAYGAAGAGLNQLASGGIEAITHRG